MVGNIYKEYNKIVAPYEAKGLIPVIYLHKVNQVQINKFMKISTYKVLAPRELELVKFDGFRYYGANLMNCILFAKNEENACEAFHRRALYERKLARCMDVSVVPSIYGIDAHGDIRSSNYIPMLNLKNVSNDEFDFVINYANSHFTKINVGSVCGEQKDADVSHLYFKLRNELAGGVPLEIIRSKALNSIYKYLSSRFDVERLDDRGGTDVKNISARLTPLGKQKYLENLHCAENNEIESIIDEKSNVWEEKYENLSQVR